jgi:hypothetical protein
MNQQQIQNGLKYTLAQINHINWIGIELEGYWSNGHRCIKGDSSVEFENYSNSECNGECRDNCECSSYCECNDCKKCEICDNEINACDCDSCLFCLDCENHYDDCCCTIISSCKKESCNNDNICDECMDSFQELRQLEHDCISCSNYYNDCTLDCSCDCNCDCDCEENNEVGEVASPKLKINEAADWILKNYPDEVNATCGLHIWLSFLNDKIDYHTLATEEFYDYFLLKIESWAINRKINRNSRFFKRLNGVQYAQREFHADSQIQNGDDKYYHLNYNYNKFGGLEIRCGNMFDEKSISVEYVNEVIKIVNDYLNTNKPIVYKFHRFVNLAENYKFTLDLTISQEKQGLKIYAKSADFSRLYYCDYNKTVVKRFENKKVEFFYDMVNSINQNQNFDKLYEYNEKLEMLMPNMTFLKLKGLNNGKTIFINGMYSKTMIEKYMDSIDDYIELFVKELIV